jgi:hypothetical protein
MTKTLRRNSEKKNGGGQRWPNKFHDPCWSTLHLDLGIHTHDYMSITKGLLRPSAVLVLSGASNGKRRFEHHCTHYSYRCPKQKNWERWMYRQRCPRTKEIRKYACPPSPTLSLPSLLLLFMCFACIMECSRCCLPVQLKRSDACSLRWITFCLWHR